MSISTTFESVAALVRETLALADGEAISPQQLLFYDLSFTSMDMLDLLFRIEQKFRIAIPEGTLYQLARGDLEESRFAEEGVLTALGRERLMALLYDTPAPIFPARIHSATLPRYCTVAAIARLVDHKIRERDRCSI
jgi:acyl carrier protein